MSTPTGVSRRLQQCVERLQIKDYEGALVNLFPAIDKTAKKRRPSDGVGKRIKGFLKDEEVLITAVGMGNIFKDCSFYGMSLEEILYKFGRTSIAHEGELDHRLSFNEGGSIQIARDNWNLPSSYIADMALAVIIAPESRGEKTQEGLGITILTRYFYLMTYGGNLKLFVLMCARNCMILNYFHKSNLTTASTPTVYCLVPCVPLRCASFYTQAPSQ